MPWTAPRTWTAAEVLKATDLNTNVRDNIAYLYNKLAETILADAAASITLTIPTTYRHLIIDGQARSAKAAVATDTLVVRFNADDGANYSYQLYYNSGGGKGAATSSSQTSGAVGIVLAAGAAANHFGGFTVHVHHHAGTTFNKTYVTQSAAATGSGLYFYRYGGLWANSAAITSITLFALGGNLIAGSMATAYGLPI